MKKIFVTVSTWLRSIVTAAIKGEGLKVKGENNVDDNVNVNVGSASALPKPTDL